MIICLYGFLLFFVHLFLIYLTYFITLSMMSYSPLKNSKPRAYSHAWPTSFDLFSTLISASILSSLSIVEVEVFSYNQLIITNWSLPPFFTLLGLEIFTSMIGVMFAWFNLPMLLSNTNSGNSPNCRTLEDQFELGTVSTFNLESHNTNNQVQNGNVDTQFEAQFY